GFVSKKETAVLDSTAHALKFSGFQDMYFENKFSHEYGISPDKALVNFPVLIHPKDLKKVPAPGKPLKESDFKTFLNRVSDEIAEILNLKNK
ncbi:MAG: threonine synthase, partial [Proteobacteria bacterium]|nr:threonine synthase [Pseudomonadota bacterium]